MARSGKALFASIVTLLIQPAFGANIALNKPVSVVSGAGSLLVPTPSPAVITDGLFPPEATSYSVVPAINGALRRNTGLAGSTSFEIQLGSPYTIDGIIIQADDNDAFLVSYLDSNNTFQPLYDVSFLSVGLRFRTLPNADQSAFAALAPMNTTTIRVTERGRRRRGDC